MLGNPQIYFRTRKSKEKRLAKATPEPNLGRQRSNMELDLIDVHYDLRDFKPRELEEILEDPFGLRLLPDSDREDGEARYFALGRTVTGRHLFLCFWTDGKTTRVIAAREMTENENRLYERRYATMK